MVSIRFHGRGGQGAVLASKLFAHALFREGWEVQAFPSFDPQREGGPVAAFRRADRHPITLRCQICAPDGVIVLDPLLMQDVDVALTGLGEEIEREWVADLLDARTSRLQGVWSLLV